MVAAGGDHRRAGAGAERVPVVVGRRGVSVPARFWAKVKTLVQDVAVGMALVPVSGGGYQAADRAVGAVG